MEFSNTWPSRSGKRATASGSPYSYRIVRGFFSFPQNYQHSKNGETDLRLSSLSEKTRKSNHLQMKLQRQHFLLSYLKTPSVGPVEVSNSRHCPVHNQVSQRCTVYTTGDNKSLACDLSTVCLHNRLYWGRSFK